MFNDYGFSGPMMGGFGLLGMVLYGIFTLIAIGISVGVTILLVRFLVITTKAAQLYIAKNSPAKAANASPVTPAPAATTPAKAATPAAATPAKATTPTKPRTPKTPPVV